MRAPCIGGCSKPRPVMKSRACMHMAGASTGYLLTCMDLVTNVQPAKAMQGILMLSNPATG